MSTDRDFGCDTEFLKLLTRRIDVDPTIAALELARDADPAIDFESTLCWIEERVEELTPIVAQVIDERDLLESLGRCLADGHGLRGDPEAYDCAEGNFLHRVIETGAGNPISLSVLYMAVAGRLGIALNGVSAPMHFLTRYESLDGPLFLDAFSGGRIMTREECLAWLVERTGLPTEELRATLKPVRTRDIVLRMLNNLKSIYSRQENWHAAWMTQHRLAVLQPASYQERRDLALISLQAGRPGSAIDLLRSCLGSCPEGEKETLERQLTNAVSSVSKWN